MSIEKESITIEDQKEVVKKQLFNSNMSLNMVDANKKYLNLLTSKIRYKHEYSKQKMEVYMNCLLQNILLLNF